MEGMEMISMNTFMYKNVLVTGGAGFVGSHLVEELLKRNTAVVVVDNNCNKKSYLFTEKLNKKIKVSKMNICNYKKLLLLIDEFKIDFIFHLAAQALVEEAYNNPKRTLDNNIMSTINVLEAVRTNPRIKGVVVASSDKAYGDLLKKKYKESDPLVGAHPYEVSKSATDLISTSYFKTYGTPVVVTRFGNIYGEGDLHFSRIIPGIMESLVKKKKFKIRSNGKYIRSYLYVKDVVNGYILLAENIAKIKGEAFNFGSNNTVSVVEMIKLIQKMLNKKIEYKIVNSAKSEIPYQALDYTKIKTTLGWYNKYTLKDVIPVIYQWYKKIL